MPIYYRLPSKSDRLLEFFHNRSDFLQQTVGGKLRFSPLERWQVTLAGGRSLDELDSVNNPASTDVFDTRRQSASLQNDIALAPDHLLTAGFDYYKDLVESNVAFAETSRDNKAGFAHYQGAFNGLDWVLGVRHDANQRFGNETTGNVTLGYTFGPPLRLTAGLGPGLQGPELQRPVLPRIRQSHARSGALRECRARRQRDCGRGALVAQRLLY